MYSYHSIYSSVNYNFPLCNSLAGDSLAEEIKFSSVYVNYLVYSLRTTSLSTFF